MSHQLAHTLGPSIQASLAQTQGTASRSTWQGHRNSCRDVLLEISAVGQGTKTPWEFHSKLHLKTQSSKWVLVQLPASLNL